MKNTISTYQAQTPKNSPPPPLYAIPHSSSQLPIPTPHFQFSILHFQFFLLLSIASLSAQSYTPMAVDGARWIYVDQELKWPPDGCRCIKGFHSYFIEGDTLINGHTYYRVYYQQMAAVNGDHKPPFQGTMQPRFQGYLRDDTLLKKVYFLPPGGCHRDSLWTERVFYEFDKKIGDSLLIYHHCSPFHDGQFLVDSISYQSAFRLEGPITTSMPFMSIKNMGSLKAIRYTTPSPWILYTQYEALGWRANKLFRGGCSGSCLLIGYCRSRQACDIVLDIGLPDNTLDLHLAPNPAYHYLELTYPLSALASIEVLDLYGRVMSQHHPRPGTETTRLDISALTQGLYLLRVLDAQGQVLAWKKWVKAAMP